MSRAFPVELAAGDTDPRFTFGLVLDVAKVLAGHGFPDLTDPAVASGVDFVELRQALYRFIHVREEGTT